MVKETMQCYDSTDRIAIEKMINESPTSKTKMQAYRMPDDIIAFLSTFTKIGKALCAIIRNTKAYKRWYPKWLKKQTHGTIGEGK